MNQQPSASGSPRSGPADYLQKLDSFTPLLRLAARPGVVGLQKDIPARGKLLHILRTSNYTNTYQCMPRSILLLHFTAYNKEAGSRHVGL